MFGLVALLPSLPPVAAAQDAPKPTFEQSVEEGKSQGQEFFKALHRSVGEGARWGEVLRACGYAKEADEMDTFVTGQYQKKVAALTEDALNNHKVSIPIGLAIALERAQSAWVGYISGFREALAIHWRLAPRNVNEAFCQAGLKHSREWLEALPRS